MLAASCRCAPRGATAGQHGVNHPSAIVNPEFNHQWPDQQIVNARRQFF
jgi:hypothetical protein